MTEWMKQVNHILKRHRIAYKGILIRFGATKYPIPTVAIVIYENGEKIGEFSIRNLAEFIADLNAVLSIIRINANEEKSDQKDEKSEQKEDEQSNSQRKRFKKKAPKRD